ncbi:MAG: hypothetical protein GY794_22870 [bacterium]|nr:hypothetical protein [bacterium]
MSRSYENGRISGLSAGGDSLSYGYDPAGGRFESITYQPGTPEEQSFNYGYLPNSNGSLVIPGIRSTEAKL